MFPSNASKPCWTMSGRNCAPNWITRAARIRASFLLLIPSPRVTTPEPMTPTEGSVSGFSWSPAARPTSSCCTLICAILPMSCSRKPSVFWASISSTPRSIKYTRRNPFSMVWRKRSSRNASKSTSWIFVAPPSPAGIAPRSWHTSCVRELAEAVFFSSTDATVPPNEVLHKKAVVLAPGSFDHVDPAHAQIHTQLLTAGIQELRKELGETNSAPIGIFCLSAASLKPEEPGPEIPDLLRRIDALLARGADVLLFRERELYAMTAFVNRYTKAPLRFVAGLSLLIRAFEDPYGNLEGRRLEAISRLFAQNVRIYAYPMTAADLEEWIKSFSASGWEWSATNGWVSAEQLRLAPPLGHLYAYLLAKNFLAPMQIPVAPAASELSYGAA